MFIDIDMTEHQLVHFIYYQVKVKVKGKVIGNGKVVYVWAVV